MRMSDVEAVMWAVEKDPALRSDFCNLTILDHKPDEKRLRHTLDRALAAIPRLRQRVVSPPLRIAPPEFADDPGLDLDYHVRRIAVPAPHDMRALLDVCEQLAESSLDRSRPLWEFTLLDEISGAGGRAALLQKVHHTISDGVGGLKLSMALLDTEPDLIAPPAPDHAVAVTLDGSRGPVEVLRSALSDATTRNIAALGNVAGSTASALVHPTTLPGRAVDSVRVARSLHRQGFVADRAHSDLIAGRSLRRHFEVLRVSLDALKRVANAHGGSVNDAYVTGICAALGRYHARSGSGVRELRMAMPVSTRGRGDTGANRFAPARVLVPIQPAHDLEALFDAVHERLATTKQEPALGVIEKFAGLAMLLPTAMLVAFTRNQARTIDFAASNLRGSPIPLYLAGARIVASYPFGPRAGTAINVTTLGYADALDIGINVDPAAVEDVDGLMIDFRAAFAALDALAD
jgi:diacylglycerol O-acyltransferase / wax synthase